MPFMAFLSLGLDSLCAPFLYLNFNNEGEYLFLLGLKGKHSLSSVSNSRQMCAPTGCFCTGWKLSVATEEF